MKRTDKLANNLAYPAYFERGAPVLFRASFDVTEHASNEGRRRDVSGEQHLCFVGGEGGAPPDVILVELMGHGGSTSISMRGAREVTTGVSEHVGLYAEVFPPANVVALRGHGFSVDAYRALVGQAWRELDPEASEGSRL